MKKIVWGRNSAGCLEVQAQSSSMQCLGGADGSAEPLVLWHWHQSPGQARQERGSGRAAAPEVRADTSRTAWGTTGAAAHAKPALRIDSLIL